VGDVGGIQHVVNVAVRIGFGFAGMIVHPLAVGDELQ